MSKGLFHWTLDSFLPYAKLSSISLNSKEVSNILIPILVISLKFFLEIEQRFCHTKTANKPKKKNNKLPSSRHNSIEKQQQQQQNNNNERTQEQLQ